jgi:hypothetical protein
MNTSWQWLRSSRFGRRAVDVALAVYSWTVISMCLLLATTALLVVLPIVLILLVLVLVFRLDGGSIYARRYTRNRTRFSNVETRRK